ncbi:MAG TPA: hypothetical protein ENH94_04215 [Phycisphaerales bacterium]|nr:hypothetical protein [Phycisphaerales bacterium]
MVPSNSKTIPMFAGITMTSAGTVFGTVDTLGFDYLTVDLVAGSGAAASTAVATMRMAEDDTLLTAHTAGDALTQFVGAAAVSTSAGFVLPALSSTKQNVYRFNMDLKGRKRYISINFAPELQTVGVGCNAVLHRVADGADIRTVGTASDGMRLIQNG